MSLPRSLVPACLAAIERASLTVLGSPDIQRLSPPAQTLFSGLHSSLVRGLIAEQTLPWRALAELHQSLLATRAEYLQNPRRLSLVCAPTHRQSRGAYYTPEGLVDLLLEHGLTPLLDRCLRAPDPCSAILSLKLLDPACGAGHFLAAAADRLASALHCALGDSSDEGLARARRLVVSQCIHGVDLDPLAVEIARFALGEGARLCVADALSNLGRKLENTLFPEVLLRGGFDLVLGNPPFLNAIDGRAPGSVLPREALRGTADTAYHFLSLAEELRAPGGLVAMIQPRSLLGAPSAASLREKLSARGVAMIYSPERASFFSGARVSIAALVLADSQSCRVSIDPEPRTADFHSVSLQHSDWWRALYPRESLALSGKPLSARFEVHASMSAKDAYELRAALSDAPEAEGTRLVTTGLIDPEKCLWGARACRYLGKKYLHPRVDPGLPLTASLARRAALWARPKVLVAGLSTRMECFFDPAGEYAGSVSTWTLTHPENDCEALRELSSTLCARWVTEEFINSLGASRLAGGSITVTRRFLEELRVLEDCLPT